MAYCRYCGKSLVNGQCDCAEFRKANGQSINSNYQEAYQKEKEPFLIQKFNLNFSSVSGFISSVRDQSGMSEPLTNSNDPYEHNVPIVPDCIQPEENEIVVKQYNIARLRTRIKFMKAEGRLMVTNRRVLFRATGTSLTGNIAQEHQFNIDEIGGIEMHKDYKFSFLSMFGCLLLYFLAMFLISFIFAGININGMGVIGLLLGIAFMAPTFVVYKHFWIKLLSAMVGTGCLSMSYLLFRGNWLMLVLVILADIILILDLIIVCFVPNLVMQIKTKSATGAVVIGSKKSMFRRQTGDDYSGFAEVLPWDDTIMAMDELGTMIEDLQKQGDYAVEKWS